MQCLTMPSHISSAAVPARQSKPVSRLTRAGLVLGVCAALGVGMLAGPHSTTSQHAAAMSAQVSTSGSGGITGGPGDM